MPGDDSETETPDLVIDGEEVEEMVEKDVASTKQLRVGDDLYEFKAVVNGKVV